MNLWQTILGFIRTQRIKDQLEEVQLVLDLTPEMEIQNKNPFVRFVQNREQQNVEG